MRKLTLPELLERVISNPEKYHIKRAKPNLIKIKALESQLRHWRDTIPKEQIANLQHTLNFLKKERIEYVEEQRERKGAYVAIYMVARDYTYQAAEFTNVCLMIPSALTLGKAIANARRNGDKWTAKRLLEEVRDLIREILLCVPQFDDKSA